MQNRYTGDIGDFGKLGMLRALRAAGLSVGVNWYLTPDETHNEDGRHIGYLVKDEYRLCDEGLWLELKAIVDSERREVESLQSKRILDATFFPDLLDFNGKKKPERIDHREKWYRKSLAALAGCDIVFADPDNGLIVPSAEGRPKENKYVLREELAGYYAQGSSVVYYQHKARRKDPFYVKHHEALVNSQEFPDATGLALKFAKTSQRYYLFIIQPQHQGKIVKATGDMLATHWGEHFERL